jgi:tetratricopeptide (TPR) repeat protein
MRDNYAAEVKALTQHLGAHPESMIFARLADRYLHLHEVEKAVEICQRGLRNHPSYASAHFILAKCYLALNQFDEAEKHLKHIISQDPQFLNAHKTYGDLMAKMGLSSRERLSLARIHDYDPLFPLAFADSFAEPEFSAPAPLPVPPVKMAPGTSAPVFAEPEPLIPAAPRAEVPPAESPRAKVSPVPEMEVRRPIPPLHEYVPPLPDLDLDEFARELEALDVPADEEIQEKPSILSRNIEPLAEPAEEIREPVSDFEREEMHFSEILDDLFSIGRDEEERSESEARHSIETAALKPESSQPVSSRPPLASEPKPPESKFPGQPPAAQAAAEKAEFPEARRMSPVLPFRADEEWQEESVFAAPAEPETPIRLEPPAIEPSPFLEPEEETPLASTSSGLFPGRDDELSEHILTEEEEEEQFTDFLSNLDRLGNSSGEVLAEEEEEEEEKPAPDRRAQLDSAWDDEPESAPEAEPQEPIWSIPHRSVNTPLPAEEESDQTGDQAEERTKEKFVTPTLGEIYAAQGQYAKAINVFEMLLKKNPENEWYRTKLDYLRKRLDEEKK